MAYVPPVSSVPELVITFLGAFLFGVIYRCCTRRSNEARAFDLEWAKMQAEARRAFWANDSAVKAWRTVWVTLISATCLLLMFVCICLSCNQAGPFSERTPGPGFVPPLKVELRSYHQYADIHRIELTARYSGIEDKEWFLANSDPMRWSADYAQARARLLARYETFLRSCGALPVQPAQPTPTPTPQTQAQDKVPGPSAETVKRAQLALDELEGRTKR